MEHQIIYNQNKQGRDGHQLKDLFSAIMLEHMIPELTACYSPSWGRSNFILNASWDRENLPLPNLDLPKHNLRPGPIKRGNKWLGLPWENFESMRTRVDRATEPTRFIADRMFRILPKRTFTWEDRQLIPLGTTDRALNKIRNMFWKGVGGAEGETLTYPQIAMHVRRGDVAKQHQRGGKLTTNMIKTRIGMLLHVHKLPIVIITEEKNSEDLDALASKHVTVQRGGPDQINQHLLEMVSSEYFIPSDSGFSYWATLLRTNTTYLMGDVMHLPKAKDLQHVKRFKRKG